MHIARLTLKDFKSFGGSHELPLSPGMTAIVGPNGSGKSNLLDALRWVLGDSRASKLRAARQGGLIFHGSVSRGKADEAEVSIRMRDGDRHCAIRRRVSEAGAFVTVDGSRVTLTELDEVKRLWSLAGDQFAFIGQGEVAEVIQQRPAARRVLLESLFGIDAYRRRRAEAADRLEEAKAEYEKLSAFSAELTARRAEIAPEVARAREARLLLDEQDGDRRRLYWARRAAAEASLEALAPEADAARASAESAELWRARWERASAFARGNIAELSSSRQGRLREMEETRVALASITRAAYGHGSALSNARRRDEAARAESEASSQKLASLRAELADKAAESRRAGSELTGLKAALEEAERKYEASRSAFEAAKAAQADRQRALGEVEGEMTALKSRMRSVSEALRAIEVEGAADVGVDPAAEVERELARLELEHQSALDAQQAAAEEHRALYARLETVTAELQRARRESSRLASRLAETQEQASAELYPRPVQHILSASRLGRVKCRPEAVIDAFECGADIAGAIEAFLGGRQFWLLVDTMDEAGECIDALKKNQAGRATFLPLERARPRYPDFSARLPVSGIVGWAMDLITPSKKWRPALEHLMGDLLIAEDYATGQSLVRGGFKGPIATPDGDVFQPGGTVSGGRAKKPGKAIEIKSALASLERESAAARSEVERLGREFERLEADEAKAAAKKDEASAAIRALAARRSELDATREERRRERARAASERDSMAASLADGARRYAELAARRRELLASAEAREGERNDDADAASREIERLKAAVALTEERSRSAFVLSERVANEARELDRALSALDEERADCAREIAENRAALERLARRYAETAARRREAIRADAEFAERCERAAASRERREARLEAAKQRAAEAERARADTASRAAALERELAELIQSWEEQYPYPPAPEGEPHPALSIDAEAVRRAIRERERRVKALGDIDMGVLSEDKSLDSRLSYLGSQLDDARGCMAELAKMITDADEQARSVFTNALEEIDEKFGALFKRLFTGGDARLEMIEGESLWDSGVDVIARPPGKHPQSITQLSGGEQSLSAIALLFASLDVANCPIAVLDEVDAALDEVNLRRFAELTKEASAERQIFVMTHRRATMERADVLYGITLAEPGLSQVIGVRVEDWA